jgi:hypothetical protein
MVGERNNHLEGNRYDHQTLLVKTALPGSCASLLLP